MSRLIANPPSTVLEVLDAMDQKFSDPSKWTQGWYSKNAQGQRCREDDSEATCWCLVGCAISVSPDANYPGVLNEVGTQTVSLLREMIRQQSSHNMPHWWNDDPWRTFEDVKDLIRRGKEQAK